MKDYFNKRYQMQKASGKCITCGGDKGNTTTLRCEKCAELHRKQKNKHKRDRETQEKIRLLNIIREMVGYKE